MKIKIIQWNISYSCKIDNIIEFIESKLYDATIICLQEVLSVNKVKLIENLKPDDYSFSLDHRKPGKFDGKNRKLGVLTLVFGGTIQNSIVLERTVFPDRTLFVDVNINDQKINILNFHSLTGVSYKSAKSSNFNSIAEFLHYKEPDFFCCDANEPKKDSFVIEELEFFNNYDKGKAPSLIFGKSKVHSLEDTVKLHKEKFNKLPYSYVTKNTPRRYDYIFKSNEWATENIEYLYEDSIKASSDHAMVVGLFKKIDRLQ